MIAFLTGFLISALAAVPALLLIFAKRGSGTTTRMKLWALGAFIRFAIIGIFLLLLFRLTELDRVLVVFGIIAAYFTSYGIEIFLAKRQATPE
jgi:hypothetical protein